MEITKVKQHFISFGESSLEEFIAQYRATPLRSLRKAAVESLDMQTNDEWLAARHAHITASNISKFLSGGRAKSEVFGDTAKGIVDKYLDEIADGCYDDMETRVETYQMKQGLIFEKRAIQLFEEATGMKVDDEIGFISDEINSIKFGCSPDGVIRDESGKIVAIVEVKSRTGAEYRAERNKMGNKATIDQMQMGMLLADCPRAFFIMYDIAYDRIQFISWTRGMAFKRRLVEQIDHALNYIATQYDLDTYTDLKDRLKEDIDYTEGE